MKKDHSPHESTHFQMGNILYDSIISLGLVTDNQDKRYKYFMMRSESLDGNLLIRRCNPHSDTSLIKESLFLIRHLKESSFEGISTENEQDKNQREVAYNSLFILQHLISKKFLAKRKNSSNNTYSLRLVEKEELSMPFTLKRIVDNKSAQSNINYNNIIYLSVYVKEKSQYYFVNSCEINQSRKTNIKSSLIETILNKDNRSDILDIVLTPNYDKKFFLVNQEHYQDCFDSKIFSGDLLNIIFTLGDKRCMLGLEPPKSKKVNMGTIKEEIKEDINILSAATILSHKRTKSEVENFNFMRYGKSGNNMIDKNTTTNFKVIPLEYTKDEYYKHVNSFSFWVIEEDSYTGKKVSKTPIISGDRVRLKNAISNMYLAVQESPDETYNFVLVEEDKLTINSFLISNFQINYYAINVEDQHLGDSGKYIIKLLFTDINELAMNENLAQDPAIDLNYVYSKIEPITLIQINDNFIVEPSEGEFVFEIKKIPLLSGNEPIYIKSIINQLDSFVDSFSQKKSLKNSFIIDLIKRNLQFFSNYLLNLDSSFKDPNLNINYPITYRQNLLISYKILKIINKIIIFFTKSNNLLKNLNSESKAQNLAFNLINSINNKEKINNPKPNVENNISLLDQLKDLVKQIFLFLIYLSENNENIKKKIFNGLKDLIDISEILFTKKTILLYFILKIVEGSTVLQEALFSELNSEKIFNVKFFQNEQNGITLNQETNLNNNQIALNNFNININNLNSLNLNKPQDKEKIKISINLKQIFKYIDQSPKYFYFYRKLLSVDKVSYKRVDLDNEIKAIILEKKFDHIEQMIKKCKKIQKTCEEGILEGTVNKHFYDNIRIFLNLLPKFDLNCFLYMDKCLTASLLKLSKPENAGDTRRKSPNERNERNSRRHKLSTLAKFTSPRKSPKKIGMMNNQLSMSNINIVKNLNDINQSSNKSEFILNNINSKIRDKEEIRETIGDLIERDIESLNSHLPLGFESNSQFNRLIKIQNVELKNLNNQKTEKSEKNEKTLKTESFSQKSNSIDTVEELVDEEEVAFVKNDSFNLKQEMDKQINIEEIIFRFEDHHNPYTKLETDQLNILLSKTEYFDNKLTYLMSQDIKSSTYQEIYDFEIESEVVVTLPSKLYLEFFPQEPQDIVNELIKSSEAFFNKGTSSNLYNKLRNSSSSVFLQKSNFERFNRKLNNLIFYYQFNSLQFFEALYKMFKILKTYCINYMDEKDIDRILENLAIVQTEVIEKICNLRNDKFKNNIIDMFCKINVKENSPSLLYNSFNFDSSAEINEEEFYNYKYLFKFCKINDKITFLLHKIKNHIELHTILRGNEYYQQTLSEGNVNRKTPIKISEKFNSIIANIASKRNLVLTLYNNIKEEKDEYNNSLIYNLSDKKTGSSGASTSIFMTSFYKVKNYLLKSRFKFFTRLLYDYDISNYFDKIIYIKDEQQLKLMKNSSKEFKILKFNIQRILGEYRNMNDDKLVFNNSLNLHSKNIYQECIENMVKSLKLILKQFKTIYTKSSILKKKSNLGRDSNLDKFAKVRSIKNEETINARRNSFIILNDSNEEVKLLTQLKNEDTTYYQKIGFQNILKNLIEVLDVYISQKKRNNYDINISLEYCFLLLKCFKQLTKNYSNFSKILQKEYMDYINLILTSLKTVENYISIIQSNITIEIDSSNLQDKNKIFLNIIYQASESFLYIIENCFVQLISSKKIAFADIKKVMSDVMRSFDHLYTVLPQENKTQYHIFYTYLVSRVLKILNRDKAYDFFNYENLFKEIFRYDKIKKRNNDCIREITTQVMNDYENNSFTKELDQSSILSEVEEKLIFNEKILFLNFLTIYTVYLNELNSMKHTSKSEKKVKSTQKIKFDTLINRINQFLDESIPQVEEAVEKDKENLERDREIGNKHSKDNKPNVKSFFKKNSIMDSIMKKNSIQESEKGLGGFININANKKKNGPAVYFNDFNFEFILLKSVIFYKYERGSIEVNVEINKRPYFLYYDLDFIDVLLLEKMMSEMNIKNRLEMQFKKYDELIDDIEEGSLKNILDEKFEFNSLMSRATQENIYYKILHDEYIQSNMIKLLDTMVKKKFTQLDFEKIDVMKFFNYVKLNDMYNDSALAKKKENKSQDNDNTLTFLQSFINLDRKNSKLLPNFNIKIENLLCNVRYMHQQFDDKISKLMLKNTMDLLRINTRINKEAINYNYFKNFIYSSEQDFEKIFENLINLFNIDTNIHMFKNSNLFFDTLKAITSMLILLKKEKRGYLIKYSDQIKTFFENSDFIFDHLSLSIEKIVNFMNNSESQTKFLKFNLKVKKLKKMMKFITNIIKFNNMKDFNILTEKMKKFNSEILEKIMRLIRILLEFNNSESNPTIILLIDFLNNFIYGPDIENLKLLFNLQNNSFFDLMKFVIRKIDYYEIIQQNINGLSLNKNLNTIIEIEYKIMQIFFVFFNLIHNGKSDRYIYLKLKTFYDEEMNNIKNKLKRVYYIHRIEAKNKKFMIEEMLLYYVDQNFYTESDLDIKLGSNEKNSEDIEGGVDNDKEIFEIHQGTGNISSSKTKNFRKSSKKKLSKYSKTRNSLSNQINSNKNIENFSKSSSYLNSQNSLNIKDDKYIIKFELLLIYYNLYILHREVMSENYINVVIGDNSLLSEIWVFICQFISLILKFLFFPFHVINFFIDLCKIEGHIKKMKNLFTELYEINEKYEKIDEKEMIEFMKQHVTSVEVCVDDNVYKVYFPILTKSQQVKLHKTKLISLNTNELENYIYHIMNNYDSINVLTTENHKVDMMLDVPILRTIFLNMNLLKGISLIIALFTNFMIMASYSDFNKDVKCRHGDHRLDCPSLFYIPSEDNIELTKSLFDILGKIQLAINTLLFCNYYIRKYKIQLTNTFNKKQLEKAKRQVQKSVHRTKAIKYLSQSLSKFLEIYIPAFFRSILNVESFFYLFAWGFCYAGIFYHEYFFGFMLIEVIVRVSVLKNVIMAIYQPRVQILVTLFLFIMFIYYFTLIAVYYFADQFPNDNDTENMFQSFMRMVDQTFKQDGGVGAYLDKTKSKNYVASSPSSYQGARFFYDYVFNLLILILVFQMFLSIIKDYFSRQREEQKKFEETVQRICLICGIEREKLEKIYSNHKNAFDIHINYDHNIYDYLCYLNYLQNKTKRDKIIENNVWELHLNNNYFFLPKDV